MLDIVHTQSAKKVLCLHKSTATALTLKDRSNAGDGFMSLMVNYVGGQLCLSNKCAH